MSRGVLTRQDRGATGRAQRHGIGIAEPHRLLGKRTHELDQLAGRAGAAVARHMYECTIHLEQSAAYLSGLNPKAVLERGYSMTSHVDTGQVIHSVQDVTSGDTLITELAGDQKIYSQVTKTQSSPK